MKKLLLFGTILLVPTFSQAADYSNVTSGMTIDNLVINDAIDTTDGGDLLC
jgi:hypothetical protein